MLINEITYLLTGFIGFLLIFWIFIKLQIINFTSILELICVWRNTCEELLALDNKYMDLLNKRKREIEEETKILFKDYDDPNKTLH